MNALDLIRGFESYRDKPYWDVNAFRAGYGSDTTTLADGRVVPIATGMAVSRDDAERDLSRRVTTEFMPRAISAVGQDAWNGMNEGQRSALLSITYNYGTLPRSVAEAVRSGDPRAASAAIIALGAHNNGVNKGRREKEAAIYAGLPPGGQSTDPQARSVTPVAYAYANGRMTPEDAKLYERGMMEGLFPKIEAPTIEARRPRPAITPLQAAPVQNATPLRNYPGI